MVCSSVGRLACVCTTPSRVWPPTNEPSPHPTPIAHRTYTHTHPTHRDYLADRPMPEVNFERSVFIKHELERIAAGRPMEPLDEARCVGVWICVMEGRGWRDGGA